MWKPCIFVAGRLKQFFCSKNLDIRHFCRKKHNIRILRIKSWENLLMRTSRKLCRPADSLTDTTSRAKKEYLPGLPWIGSFINLFNDQLKYLVANPVQTNILNIRWSYLGPTYSVLATWTEEHWGRTLGTHGGGRGRSWQGKKNTFENCPWFSLFWFRPGIYRNMWKLDKEGNLTKICQGLAHCSAGGCDDVKKIVETVTMKRVSCLPACSEGTRCNLCRFIRK